MAKWGLFQDHGKDPQQVFEGDALVIRETGVVHVREGEHPTAVVRLREGQSVKKIDDK